MCTTYRGAHNDLAVGVTFVGSLELYDLVITFIILPYYIQMPIHILSARYK